MSNVDKIILDVGGVYFETKRTTLLNSSEYFDILLSNEEDVYFVDRDPFAFQVVLNFLRQGTLHLSCEDPATIDFLLSEAQYYKLSSLQTELMQRRLNIRHTELHTEPQVKTHKMSLSKVRHNNK